MRVLDKLGPWACAGALLASSGALALSQSAAQLGWAPLVSMWGRGDEAVAVRSLREVTTAYAAVLHHTEVDAPTQKFLDQGFDQLEDFDLGGFHDILPEQSGAFRELRVRGDLSSGKYLVRRASDAGYEVALAGRRELAAMSALLRARPGTAEGDKKTFLLGGRLGLGIGALSFRALTEAATAGLRLASTGDPRAEASEAPRPSEAARTKIKALNPGLGNEDIDVLALLYDGFPAVGQLLADLGRVEDVRVSAPNASYQHVTARLRGLPERMEKRYPALAKHLDKLDELARADVRWVDSQGRSIVNAKVNTDDLTVSFDCYVKDGRLLPFRKSTVFSDEPLDLMDESLSRSRVVVDARLKMLGVIIKLDNLRVDFGYQARESYGSIDARLTTVPGIRVEGRALGFLPTGLVDAFIPGNLESLTRDFFEVAAKGNDKKGVVVHADVGSQSEGDKGVVVIGADLEALDNFLVKMGVGVVNDRVLPSDSAIADGKKLSGALHEAFVQDLSRFSGQVGG